MEGKEIAILAILAGIALLFKDFIKDNLFLVIGGAVLIGIALMKK